MPSSSVVPQRPTLPRVATVGLLALLLAIWASALAPPDASARVPCPSETAPIASTPATTLRASVLCLVNETRGRFSLPPLAGGLPFGQHGAAAHR